MAQDLDETIVLCWRTKEEVYFLIEEQLDKGRRVINQKGFHDWNDYLENRSTEADLSTSIVGFSSETFDNYINDLQGIMNFMKSNGFVFSCREIGSFEWEKDELKARILLRQSESVAWQSPDVRYIAKKVRVSCILECTELTEDAQRFGKVLREYVTGNYDMRPPSLF